MIRLPRIDRTLAEVWVFSRLLLVALIATAAGSVRRGLGESMSNWDSAHFLDIAKEGYVDVIDPAFFPGLPIVLRALTGLGADPVIGGAVVSIVASAFAALAIVRLGGPRVGRWAAMLWLIAPTAVFTVVPYTESLFCALAFWAWVYARREEWFSMAFCAALACTVRVSGLFLLGALAVLILTRAPRGDRDAADAGPDEVPLTLREVFSPAILRRAGALVWLLPGVAALFCYAWYGKARFGSWMAWYTAQTTGWARGFHWPWQSAANQWKAIQPGAYADHPGWVWIFRGEFVSMMVGLVIAVILLLRRRWAEASWVAVQVLAFSLSFWWQSVNRAVLLWFPLWLLFGEVVARGLEDPKKNRLSLVASSAYAAISLVVMCMWAWVYSIGWWAS